MRIYVFTGPTLPAEAASKELRAEYLPPVSEGDVYRVTLKKPVADIRRATLCLLLPPARSAR